MRVIEVNDQSAWDAMVAVSAVRDSGILQSWNWGLFQKNVGNKVYYFGVVTEGDARLLGGALVIEHALPLGQRYWYIPRGPLLQAGVFEFLLQELVRRAREHGVLFVRIEPTLCDCIHHQGLMRSFGFCKARRNVQPGATLLLDLQKSEHELLATMHPKTRYNIKLAEKKGVEVKCQNDFKAFWALLQETAKREGFRTHVKEYYEKLLKNPSAQLFIAEYEGQALAAALVVFCNGWALYLHGASSSNYRALMAPHLLHWAIMQSAKARGCTTYDFWGVGSGHWEGFSRFKQGFAPHVVPTTYLGTWDYPISSWGYRWYALAVYLARH